MSQRRHRFSACNHLGWGAACHRCAQATAHDTLIKKLEANGKVPTLSSTKMGSGQVAFVMEKDLILKAQIEGRHYQVTVVHGPKGVNPEARTEAIATLIVKLRVGAADLRKVPERKSILTTMVPQSA
jgi:hypothetical protein